jgi:hypothetical protein
MADTFTRPSNKLDPGVAWTIVTDAPLKGIALAREALRLLAWDDAGQVYLLDTEGQFLAVSRTPGPVLFGAISDDGSLIALVGEGARLWLYGADLEMFDDRAVITDPTALAIDAHGRYLAVASKMNLVQFYNRHGKLAGRFETRQHLSLLAFVPGVAVVVGVGAFGSISCYELAEKSSGKLEGEMAWTEQLMSGVGRLSMTGDGGMILIACYTHGVQRFDLRGQNEGAYHLGGSASLAVPDFPGRTIAVATQEGDLAILNGTGNVRWKTTLPRPAVALEVDALGRFIIYGLASGEITRLDLQGGGRPGADSTIPPTVSARPGGGPVRSPDWSEEVVPNEDQAEFAVLAVVDDPPRVAVISNKNRLELFDGAGRRLGLAPEIAGVGRILRTCPGWIAAATDRQVMLCDLRKNTAQKLDVSLVEVTHMAIRPDLYGLAIVQERDRIGRATVSGRWIWKTELKVPVEELAIGPDGQTAITTETGLLWIYDPAGTVIGEYRSDPPEPLLLTEAPAGSARGVIWITLARRHQVIRGHDLTGRVVWESPIPWEAWGLCSVGPMVVASAADGRAVAYDGAGHARAQGGRSETSLDIFYAGEAGDALRVSRQGVHLICSTLDGRVSWRAVADAPLGQIAAGRSGVAVMIGKSVAWFSDQQFGGQVP